MIWIGAVLLVAGIGLRLLIMWADMMSDAPGEKVSPWPAWALMILGAVIIALTL